MEKETKIPEGYMKDAAGRLVPIDIVKPTEKLEDQLVKKSWITPARCPTRSRGLRDTPATILPLTCR